MNLLPCPFCGSNDAALDMDHSAEPYPFCIWCKSCGARADNNSTASRAIESWNRRPEPTTIAVSVGREVLA